MALGRGKTEHDGARDMSRKHGFWGHADEAKKWASRARRQNEKREVGDQFDAHADDPDDVQITRMLVQGSSDAPFSVMVEPEAMSYDLPPQERVLLTFRGPVADAQFEVVHGPDYLTVWRPADTEVWATLADGTHEQIGGWAHNPAPWLDSAAPDLGPPPWERS